MACSRLPWCTLAILNAKPHHTQTQRTGKANHTQNR